MVRGWMVGIERSIAVWVGAGRRTLGVLIPRILGRELGRGLLCFSRLPLRSGLGGYLGGSKNPLSTHRASPSGAFEVSFPVF